MHQSELGTAPLHGLVLGGGQSTRMGRDKAQMVYPSRSELAIAAHLRELLLPYCEKVHISLRAEQDGFSEFRLNDTVAGAGPGVGILSAHAQFPGASWLILACDFPFVEENLVRFLIENRRAEKASTYFLQSDGKPEPLFSVWEAPALGTLAKNFTKGFFGPRAALEETAGHSLVCPWPEQLINVNSPADAARHSLS